MWLTFLKKKFQFFKSFHVESHWEKVLLTNLVIEDIYLPPFY